MGKPGANKVIPGGERTLILKVLRYFEEEKRNGAPILPVNNVLKRTCAATGVSLGTVTRIKREEKKILAELGYTQAPSRKKKARSSLQPTPSAAITYTPTIITTDRPLTMAALTTPPITTTKLPLKHSLKTDTPYIPRPVVTLPTPGKNRRRRAHNKMEINDYTVSALRDIINRLHANNKFPSLPKILAVAKEELNFPGKRDTLRKILKERLGYTAQAFKKCGKSNQFLADIIRPEIAALNSLVEIKAPEMHVSNVFVTDIKK